MKLNVKVRQWLPSWSPMAGITIKPYIITKKGNYGWIIPHETVHIQQQEQYGLLGFALRYYFSRKLRAQFEAAGYAQDVKRGYRTAEQAASCIAGKLYFWPCTYVEALKLVREECEKLT